MAFVNRAQKKRDRTGRGNQCVACGYGGTDRDPVTLCDSGDRVHLSHIIEPGGVLYGRAQR